MRKGGSLFENPLDTSHASGASTSAPLTVRTEHFEGPLDLLLFLIQTHELDISKISLSKVTDQYLSYVRMISLLDIDMAGEFLVVSATLIYWKSKAVLPQDPTELASLEDEMDGLLSPESLIQQLREHQRFLAQGQELASRPKLHEDVFIRENHRPPIERIWREMNISELSLSVQDCFIRARRRKTILKKETVSLSQKIQEFAMRLPLNVLTELHKLFSIEGSRGETVVTFLAALELARMKKIQVFQEGHYQPILVKLCEEISQQDLTLAIGFDALGAQT